MTLDEARAAYGPIQCEISGYLCDVRPKLKSYDGALVHDRVREVIIAAFPTATTAEQLRAVALDKLRSYPFNYLKGKGPLK